MEGKGFAVEDIVISSIGFDNHRYKKNTLTQWDDERFDKQSDARSIVQLKSRGELHVPSTVGKRKINLDS